MRYSSVPAGLKANPKRDLYVFDQRGTLIANALVKKNQVQIEIKDDSQHPSRLILALPPPSVTLADMERLRGYEPMWSFDPNKTSSDAYVSFKVRHHNNFATFSFTIASGSVGVAETASGIGQQ
ncbi:MAG: hypothetical protein JSR71_10365 [Proteobacteria bacterium]|nr:hypothetical protein [Pseudomonadota bacterium]